MDKATLRWIRAAKYAQKCFVMYGEDSYQFKRASWHLWQTRYALFFPEFA